MTIESKKKMLENAKSSFSPEQNLSFLLLIDMGLLLPSILERPSEKDGREGVWRSGGLLWWENKNRSITR